MNFDFPNPLFFFIKFTSLCGIEFIRDEKLLKRNVVKTKLEKLKPLKCHIDPQCFLLEVCTPKLL